MKKFPSLLFHSALTGSLACAHTTSDIRSGAPSQPWQASITAGTNKDRDAAPAQVTIYQTSGGNAYLADLRAAWFYYLEAEQLQPWAINPLPGLRSVSKAEGDNDAIDKAAHPGQMDEATADFQTLLGVNSTDTWSQKGLALCQARKSCQP